MFTRLVAEAQQLPTIGDRPPCLIGLHTGGVWVAEYLHRALEVGEPLGRMDPAFYRDDYGRIGLKLGMRENQLPWSIEDRRVILVDDVLHTGRTIRAALGALFDYGRPACVQLAVLIEREGRELPIRADAAGARVHLPAQQRVKLRGPEPLQLIHEAGA